MRYSSKLLAGFFLGATTLALLGPGCGNNGDSGFGDQNNPDGGGDLTDAGGGFPPGTGLGDGSSGTNTQCNTNLCLKRVSCPNGGDTTISGIVYDPAGKTPLYQALVFVPNEALKPIATGPSCDRCDGTSNVYSGAPVSYALTDSQGRFTLKNVPVDNNIPLVVQLGKWRRENVTINVNKCVDNKVTVEQTRLPQKQSEGHIPKIAISTGSADSMECWPRRIGIDDHEFTIAGKGNGRIDLYKGADDGDKKATGQFSDGTTLPDSTTLWGTAAQNKLNDYDMVILSCEGQELLTVPGGRNSPDQPNKTDVSRQNLYNYLKAGGRVFASHWHESWFRLLPNSGIQPVPQAVGNFLPADPQPKQYDYMQTATVQTKNANGTDFPKGQAFSDWLRHVGASTTPGQFDIYESRQNLTAATPVSQNWAAISDYGRTPVPPADQSPPDKGKGTAVQFLSFNAPIGASDTQVCGRAVYTDLHVSSGAAPAGASAKDNKGDDFPKPECMDGDLSAQEKALEFMLFDLSSCVSNDQGAPPPPVVIH